MLSLKAVVLVLLPSLWGVVVLVGSPVCLWAFANGSLSGTLKDQSGAVISGATITLVNTALKSKYKAISNGQGFYSFPTLPVGHYDLTIEAKGFDSQKKTNVAVNTDATLKVDVQLTVGRRSEALTVVDEAVSVEAQVDTIATHLGELVTGSQMTALPLN